MPTDQTGPDAIWAPWRLDYLESLSASEKPATRPAPPPAAPGACFLRTAWLTPARDETDHVIVRSSLGLILLNKYPYANGHLLIALGEGRARLLDYTTAQRAHFWVLLDAAVDLVEAALEPQGVNAGINQGRAAGAGVPDHLHAHVVPRWAGDVNFMTTVAQIRVVPASLDAMARRLRAAWSQIEPRWRDLLGGATTR